MLIRSYQPADLDLLRQLFRDTVLTVNRRDYSQAQVEAWAASALDVQRWRDRLDQCFTTVALIDEQIAGFGELEVSGHINCFYCHKDFQGQGVGTAILQRLEAEARSQGTVELFTEASITAQPFFQRRGFEVVRSQQVERLGQVFTNFVMKKSL